ncbi:ATP-dependent RNA helicase DDX54 [Fopius arisanus]|uniref:RNA helicase n=1 Tax=Fopius arisanus TaxID=64838 RepID=A0A0C9R8M7_9HYME|nr:PREDICTED: ATP-dependent RNA helicase DDX54 [Fopius arisanus]
MELAGKMNTIRQTELIGFTDLKHIENDDENETPPKLKTSKKSGGFQGMGLSFPLLKGILKRGYKIPTPIQRKTIPVALTGRDVVAMARTGSGKTACFLIPLFEKLKTRNAKAGARAIILSPTRELALQTLKFIKDVGKFTGLKAAVILGGDSMDNQFSVLYGNPDIIVATPGRFLHICVEMDLSLKNIELIVFDEADRLFEMGWGEQIHEITNRLPENRQTLLFSATLPKVLVEFSKAGLSDPILIRLDVENKLPNELTLAFITCREEEKLAVLLCLLKYVIANDSPTVVFAATMHHVEYIHTILDQAGITNTFIYSNLDASARKINAAKFQSGQARVLVVTDVAARGLDIPHLDSVINFHFPAKSKLFVHRVGRCARAGRSGTAYNIISKDEFPYLLDLHLFLGMEINILSSSGETDETENFSRHGAIGKMPPEMIEQELAELNCWHNTMTDLENMSRVARNGYLQYLKSRSPSSVDAVKRSKQLDIGDAGVFKEYGNLSPKAGDFLSQMKKYRPSGTIFEIAVKPSSTDYKVMKTKRQFHQNVIKTFKEHEDERKQIGKNFIIEKYARPQTDDNCSSEIAGIFSQIIIPKKRKLNDLYRESRTKKKNKLQDPNFYIPYTASDKHTEDGLAVNNFANAAEHVQMELTADNEESRRLQKQVKKWDRKKKKMITVNSNSKVGKIRTESGVWIPATYKTNRYDQWKEKSKIDDEVNGTDEEEGENHRLKTTSSTHWARHNQKLKNKIGGKGELKTLEQVAKLRKIQEKKKNKGKKPKRSKNKRRGK